VLAGVHGQPLRMMEEFWVNTSRREPTGQFLELGLPGWTRYNFDVIQF